VNPQLVILAAGLGSRYGGLKQLDAVGPGGATLMDYSVYDALRAGFGDVVFVIRPDLQRTFEDLARTRFGTRFRWRTAQQRLEDVPPGAVVPAGRVKPWGTTHAVLAAAGEIGGPFAVLNADDFYGAEAIAAVAAFLKAETEPSTHAIAGYRLGDTRSAAGPVNRGVCRIGADRFLETIEEVKGLEMGADGSFTGQGESGPLRVAGDAIVSMNLWAFQPSALDILQRGLVEFFRSPSPDESLLPTVMRAAIARGDARVRVLKSSSRWFGITHSADREPVVAAIRRLVNEGRYPEQLWT
jgi:MobA-like NTP transferase protein